MPQLTYLAEYAQEIPAADFSNLIRGKADLQHRIDYDVVEPGRLIAPCLIGAFPNGWAPPARYFRLGGDSPAMLVGCSGIADTRYNLAQCPFG